MADKATWGIDAQIEAGGFVSLRFLKTFSGSTATWATAVDIPINTWTHVAVLYDAGATANDPTMIINGTDVRTVGSGLTETAAPVGVRTTDVGSNFNLGNNAATTRTWDGLLDDIRLWSDTRTSTEIAANYDVQLAGDESGLAAYYMQNNVETSVASRATGAHGTLGGSAHFNGAESRIVIGDAVNIQDIWDGGGTVETWLYPRSDGEGNNGRVVDKRVGWRIDTDNETGGSVRLSLYYDFSGTDGWWTTATDIPLNEWTHVAVIYDADAVANNPTFIINGTDIRTVGSGITEQFTPVGTRVSDVGNLLVIGNTNAAAWTWDGLLDDLRIWSDTRTSTEIANNYDSELVGTEAGLEGYWRFDDQQVDLTYEPLTVTENAIGIGSTSAVLTANAASGQKDVEVPDGTLFQVQQDVTMADDTPDTETGVIASISGNTLTLVSNLAATYATADNATVAGDAWEFKGTIEDQGIHSNDATYEFVRDMSNLDSIKGSLSIKEFGFGQYVTPTPVSGFQAPIDPEFGGTVTGLGVPILGPLLAVFADISSLSINLLWMFFLLVVAIVVLVGVFIKVRDPIAAFTAAGIVVASGSALHVYSWFLLVIYIIAASAISAGLISKRS